MLLTLIRWLWYVNQYLLNVFTSVLFITSGKRIRKIILLYCVISIYDIITSLGTRLSRYLYEALLSCLYLRCHLSEFISNHS